MSTSRGMRGAGRSIADLLMPLLILGIFLVAATYNITVPGLYGDEALQIAPSVGALRGDAIPQPIRGVPETRVTIFGHSLTLMTMPYIGALKTFLYLPLAGAFGQSVFLMRLLTVGIAATAVLATYAFGSRAFSRGAGAAAALHLALDQSFILRTRVDWGPNAIAIAFKMLAVVCLLKWWEGRRDRYLILGGFLLGLALYNKSDFSAALAALALATLVVFGCEIRRVVRPRTGVFFTGAFLAGASVYIWYNAISSLGAFRDGNPGRVAWWQPDIYLAALRGRVVVLSQLLNGQSLDVVIGRSPWSLGFAPLSGVPTVAFCVALGAALILVAVLPHRRDARLSQPLRWLLLTMLLFVLLCAAIPGAFAHHHVINIYPFPHVLVGAMFSVGVSRLAASLSAARRRSVRLISGSLFALLLVTEGVLLLNTAVALDSTGGGRRWSDAIYRLADDLRREPEDTPLHFMDWGFADPITVLLDGRFSQIDEPWNTIGAPAQAEAWAVNLLSDPRALFVTAAPGNEEFPQSWRALRRHADQRGMRAQMLKQYEQRNRVPVFQLWRFVPVAADQPALQSSVIMITSQTRMGVFLPTTLSWAAPDGENAQLYVSADGAAEKLFASGPSGEASAPWIQPNIVYVFRLYANEDRRVLLGELRIAPRSASATVTP